MRNSSLWLTAGWLVCAAFAPAWAETRTAHVVIAPSDLVWRKAPPSFPPGSETAVLYGDPSKEGPFVLRARAPKGFRLPAHTHPAPEIVTVLSGVLRVGLGSSAGSSKETLVPAGGFSAMPAGVAHWLAIEEDAVVQINGVGPWGIDYLDPKDDPRGKK